MGQGPARRAGPRAWDLAVVAGDFWLLAARYSIDVWVERVPTVFNPADYPTRFVADDENGYVRAMNVLGFVFEEPRSLNQLFDMLQELMASEPLKE